MAYVTGGQVQQSPPLTQRISKLFDNVINFFMHFFLTLIPIDYQSSSSGSSSSLRGSGGTTGRGSGGGTGRPFGPGGGGGGSGGPRFRTIRDINPPTIGGCPGGACGM